MHIYEYYTKVLHEKYHFDAKNEIMRDSQSGSKQAIKWKDMSDRGLEWYVQKHESVFLRRLRRGVPQEYRWAAWKALIRYKKYTANTKLNADTDECLLDNGSDSSKNLKKMETSILQSYPNASSLTKTSSVTKPSISKKIPGILNLETQMSCTNLAPSSPEKGTMSESDHSMLFLNSASPLVDDDSSFLQVPLSPIANNIPESTNSVSKPIKDYTEHTSFPPYISITYKNYLELSQKNSSYSNLIRIDVPRTFPELPCFDKDAQKQLGRILNALANYKPELGYCQGINFVVGFLLLVSNFNEFETFEMLIGTMELYCFEALYYHKFALLRRSLNIFDNILKSINYDLYKHFEDEGVLSPMYLHQWILTIFVQGLPLKTTAVVWDFILAKGFNGIIIISVTLLQILQRFIINLNLESTVKFLKSLKRSGRCDENKIGRMLVCLANKLEVDESLFAPLSNLNLQTARDELIAEQILIHKSSLNNDLILTNFEDDDDDNDNPLSHCLETEENNSVENSSNWTSTSVPHSQVHHCSDTESSLNHQEHVLENNRLRDAEASGTEKSSAFLFPQSYHRPTSPQFNDLFFLSSPSWKILNASHSRRVQSLQNSSCQK